ncbi:MAG: sensor histidine kinase [Janthinobacterium lividum]
MQPQPIRIFRLRFWQQWLLHWLVVWNALALGDTGVGWYREHAWTWTHYWQVLTGYDEAATWALMLLGVEAAHHFVFRRRSLPAFLLSVTALAAGLGLVFMGVARWKLGVTLFPLGPAAFVAVYAAGYAVVRDFFHRRVRRAEARAEHSESELAALRAQLNPHFLFNTLNTLYGTALAEDAPRTAECIEQLAGLLRYTLREAQHAAAPVAQEVQFLHDYLRLQRLRLPPRPNIDLRTDIQYDGQTAVIAPLLLLPFVENAFAYGISIDQDCFVHLSLRVENGYLAFTLENRVLPGRSLRPGAGTGLRHARQRLALLYPRRHALHVGEADGHFAVRLRIDLAAGAPTGTDGRAASAPCISPPPPGPAA